MSTEQEVYRSFTFTLNQFEEYKITKLSRFIRVISATYGDQDDLQISIDNDDYGVCFVGFEIDEEYFAETKQRIINHTNQQKLF